MFSLKYCSLATYITSAVMLTVLLLSACGSGVRVQRSTVQYFDSSFSATVANKSFKVKKPRNGDYPLLDLFWIWQVKADNVQVFFAGDKLMFQYLDNGQPVEKQFAGHFKEKGYYEYYFSRKRIQIPPFIGFIYSRIDVYRVRLALTNEGDLIVDHKLDNSGNILIFGAGASVRGQSFFKASRSITK